MDVISRAKAFAKGACVARGGAQPGQKYFAHHEAVASHVWRATLNDTATAAALLHDVLDDSRITADILLDEFGFEIASLVVEVSRKSSVRDGSRGYRNAIDVAHIAKASPMGQTIKLADLIASLESASDDEFGESAKDLTLFVRALPHADPALLHTARSFVDEFAAAA